MAKPTQQGEDHHVDKQLVDDAVLDTQEKEQVRNDHAEINAQIVINTSEMGSTEQTDLRVDKEGQNDVKNDTISPIETTESVKKNNEPPTLHSSQQAEDETRKEMPNNSPETEVEVPADNSITATSLQHDIKLEQINEKDVSEKYNGAITIEKQAETQQHDNTIHLVDSLDVHMIEQSDEKTYRGASVSMIPTLQELHYEEKEVVYETHRHEEKIVMSTAGSINTVSIEAAEEIVHNEQTPSIRQSTIAAPDLLLERESLEPSAPSLVVVEQAALGKDDDQSTPSTMDYEYASTQPVPTPRSSIVMSHPPPSPPMPQDSFFAAPPPAPADEELIKNADIDHALENMMDQDDEEA